jgi:hypothetical protein
MQECSIHFFKQFILISPESKSATRRIEKVPEEHVLDVLFSNGSGAEHCKTDLHEENESSGVDEEE